MSAKAPATARLSASERREAIVLAALRVFSATSYTGATTAEIAREAGVSEPIIYRHFSSKRDLWLACLDEAWARFRAALEQKMAALGERDGVCAVAQTGMRPRRERVLLPNLWIQGLTEAAEDADIERALRRQVRTAHELIAGVIRRSQIAGGVPADRDPDTEAWIFLGTGLLVSFAERLGGVLAHEDFASIARERYRWLLEPPATSEQQP